MKIEDDMTMKMKLNPELSCLEAQEKFWRGRLKELNDKFTEEQKNMETLIIQITAENKQLKNNLNEYSANVSQCSVSVQTAPIDNENNVICEYCQRSLVKTRTIFSEDRSSSNRSIIEENNNKSEFFIDNNLVSRENTPIGHRDDENAQKTIEKLFSSSDDSNSQKITSKLVELYEKRSKSVPDLVHEKTKYDDLQEVENKFKTLADINHSRNVFEKSDVILKESEKTLILHETSDECIQTSKQSRNRYKLRFLPEVQNIRKKLNVFKNFSRIKKTYANIRIRASNNATASSNVARGLENGIPNLKTQIQMTKNEERLEQIQTSPKCQLISAIKKSKSTGNIIKKVAFSADLPTTKTVSESNLLQMNEYRSRRQSNVKSLLIGSIEVHHDKFARPVPAPRSKKNIIAMHS